MHNSDNPVPNSATTVIGTPKKRPPLVLLKRGSSVVPSPELHSATSSRENAFTFQQNSRTSFLFGKNNVFACAGGNTIPGYLSLYRDLSHLLLLKWIPNSLLLSKPCSTPTKGSQFLNLQAVSIKLETITHLHLHKRENSFSPLIVLVDADGVQQFAFAFTLEQYCFSFLKSLENGLFPLFKIDPPLHSLEFREIFAPNLTTQLIKSTTNSYANKLKSMDSLIAKTETELVFRIISFASSSFGHKSTGSNTFFSRSSTQDSKSEERISLKESLSSASKAMQDQIMHRSFIGWLSYSRHLRTIRLNLATIVTTDANALLNHDEMEVPVNEVFWKICRSEKTIVLYKQFLSRVYFCGIEPKLRVRIWPYLLRLVEWHEDFDQEKLEEIKKTYRSDLEKWTELATANRGSSANHNSAYDNHALFNMESINSDTSVKLGNSLDKKFDFEFMANLFRIQKDVERCDRNTKFYSNKENLELLQRVICTYIYRRLRIDLDDGYVQGMCDLIAPLLVIFGEEALTLACFEKLMSRMRRNFPQSTNNNGMEENLNNFRSLVEVMDPELYCQLMRNIDYSFVVFYRWLLLDFKRELVYGEVFQLWEVIWAAGMTCSRHFELFFGLALLNQYREVLLENEMDFTDVIKFFNEMAEKHDIDDLLHIARKSLRAFQLIIKDLNMSNPVHP